MVYKISNIQNELRVNSQAVCHIFPEERILAAGYYVFNVGHPCVRPSVHLSVGSTSVHSSFSFDNLSIYKRISFKFGI